MAKKQETKIKTEQTPDVIGQLEKKAIETPQPKEDKWEIKARTYFLKGKKRPLSKMIRSTGIYHFDEEKRYERELKYCENQRTPFVDEMQGDQRLSHIIFRNGVLIVPREKQALQKLLSLYHPHRNKIYFEHKPVKVAEDEVEVMELEADAILAARELDIDMVEAIMRVEIGSRVSKMSSKELKRDVMVFARRNPLLFLELANDDNVQLRNFGIKAVEEGILKLSSDQRNFLWGSNDRKLMTVPFDEHPYTALAHWFKTDEGMEIFTNIEKRLNN
jgi:hypothetical protein